MSPDNRPLSQVLVQIALMLVVADIKKSVAFYHDILGFDVNEQDSYFAQLERGPTRLYLITESEPTPDKPMTHFVMANRNGRTPVNLIFQVRDCQQAYTELSQRGMRFFTPPQQAEWGGWRCFAHDPDGYSIQLEQQA